jgi:hypothetical protein
MGPTSLETQTPKPPYGSVGYSGDRLHGKMCANACFAYSSDGVGPKSGKMSAMTQKANAARLTARAAWTERDHHETERDFSQAPIHSRDVPLTAALLDVRQQGLSFATPGHRGGRSYRSPAVP